MHPQSPITLKSFMIGALALAVAMMLALPAQARPILGTSAEPTVDSSKFEVDASPGMVVPYLSHGMGVDQSQYSGTPASGASATDNSGWYTGLEHSDLPQATSSSALDDTFDDNSGWYTGLEHSDLPQATSSSASSDGTFDWSWQTGGIAALIIAAAALGLVARQRGRRVAMP
jgi:hypothetical protein